MQQSPSPDTGVGARPVPDDFFDRPNVRRTAPYLRFVTIRSASFECTPIAVLPLGQATAVTPEIS